VKVACPPARVPATYTFCVNFFIEWTFLGVLLEEDDCVGKFETAHWLAMSSREKVNLVRSLIDGILQTPICFPISAIHILASETTGRTRFDNSCKVALRQSAHHTCRLRQQ
jgi:hypothetical protein